MKWQSSHQSVSEWMIEPYIKNQLQKASFKYSFMKEMWRLDLYVHLSCYEDILTKPVWLKVTPLTAQ